MICVLPYYRGDRDLAQKLYDWIAELGDAPPLLLVRDSRAEPIEEQFGIATDEIVVADDAWDKWPESCNWMIAKTGRHPHTEKTPWCWLEADAVPTRKGWWQALEYEWERAQENGKWFVGDMVDVDGVPRHMSGIGIYPPNVIEHAGVMLISHEVAWDVQAAGMILPKMFETKKIVHSWKHPPFQDMDQVNNLRGQHPEMFLFHADKSGSLIDLLRSELRKGGETHGTEPTDSRSEQTTAAQTWTGTTTTTRTVELIAESGDEARKRRGSVEQNQPILCDIFIKTYPPDYPWLEYCLRSVEKFANDFRCLVVAYSGASPLCAELPPVGCKLHNVGDQPDGYLWQQVIKLDADKYSDAPCILYIDSDTIFTKAVTPETYVQRYSGCQAPKIIWLMTPYEKTQTPWKPIIEKFLKRPVAFEFMRRAPQMVPRWLLSELRGFCEREHGMSLDSYIMSQPHRSFSEFNALGAFAYEFFRDEFAWVNTEETPPEEWPALTVLQSWSRGGLTPEIKKQYDEILAGEYSRSAPCFAPVGESPPPDLSAVPVLAEPTKANGSCENQQFGEARESTTAKAAGVERNSDSRGGGQNISDRIRFHCNALVEIADSRAGRFKMVLNELRRCKLAPRARRRR